MSVETCLFAPDHPLPVDPPFEVIVGRHVGGEYPCHVRLGRWPHEIMLYLGPEAEAALIAALTEKPVAETVPDEDEDTKLTKAQNYLLGEAML